MGLEQKLEELKKKIELMATCYLRVGRFQIGDTSIFLTYNLTSNNDRWRYWVGRCSSDNLKEIEEFYTTLPYEQLQDDSDFTPLFAIRELLMDYGKQIEDLVQEPTEGRVAMIENIEDKIHEVQCEFGENYLRTIKKFEMLIPDHRDFWERGSGRFSEIATLFQLARQELFDVIQGVNLTTRLVVASIQGNAKKYLADRDSIVDVKQTFNISDLENLYKEYHFENPYFTPFIKRQLVDIKLKYFAPFFFVRDLLADYRDQIEKFLQNPTQESFERMEDIYSTIKDVERVSQRYYKRKTAEFVRLFDRAGRGYPVPHPPEFYVYKAELKRFQER